jgi:hypothetical protein
MPDVIWIGDVINKNSGKLGLMSIEHQEGFRSNQNSFLILTNSSPVISPLVKDRGMYGISLTQNLQVAPEGEYFPSPKLTSLTNISPLSSKTGVAIYRYLLFNWQQRHLFYRMQKLHHTAPVLWWQR